MKERQMGGTFGMHGGEVQYIQRCGGDIWKKERQTIIKIYYIILYYVILCYFMLYYIMLFYVILYYVMLCYFMLYYIMLCYIMLFYVILYYIILYYIYFDRASSLICGNKIPTRCNRDLYCRSYCLLNIFRAPLCPSSAAQEYYTVVAACSISCCGFQVAGLVWS